MANEIQRSRNAISPAVHRKRQAATKCVYFSDDKVIDKLEEILEKYPRASLSNVISQLVVHFNTAAAELPVGDRCVTVKEAKIWI